MQEATAGQVIFCFSSFPMRLFSLLGKGENTRRGVVGYGQIGRVEKTLDSNIPSKNSH